MSKEYLGIEPIKDQKEIDMIFELYENSGVIHYQDMLKLKAYLTPPTKEEVCEVIQKEYKIEKVVYDNRRFYDKDDGETLVTSFICDGKINIDLHDFMFSVDTLIKICRFYEGLEKEEMK